VGTGRKDHQPQLTGWQSLQQRADMLPGHIQPVGPEIGGIHGGREIEDDDQRGSGGTKLGWRHLLPGRSRQCQNGEQTADPCQQQGPAAAIDFPSQLQMMQQMFIHQFPPWVRGVGFSDAPPNRQGQREQQQ